MQICLMTAVFPPAIGGPATHVFHLYQSLVADGHAVCVITLGDTPSADPRVTVMALRIQRLWRFWRLTAALWRRRRVIDIIYAHGAPWDVGLPALIVQQLTGIPVVFKVTGDNAWERAQNVYGVRDDITTFQQRRYGWRVHMWRWLQRAICQRIDRLIVPSAQLRTLAMGWGVAPARITIIPNAIVPSSTTETPAVLSSVPRVVIVGRLAPWKQVDRLLEAFVGVNSGAVLEIVGDGPERVRLSTLAQVLGIADRVQWLGRCSQEETRLRLARADVVVLASAYEGAPHVLLEAMQVGAAIVATRIPGVEALLTHEESGYLVSSGDVTALRDGIVRVLQDEALRARLRAGARARWAALPSWESVVNQTVDVLVGHARRA